MTEQSYNLKYTGKEIDALLDKANDLDESAQVPAGGTSGQVLTKKSGTDFDAQWETPGVALPTGGTAEQILTKNSNADGDASWKDAPIALPDGGTSGQVLTKNSSTDGDASWKTPETPSNPLPTGGSAGQVLAKKTDTNYDTEWIDAHSGDSNVVIAIIDENGALNKTYDELLAAVNANKVVFIKDLSDSYDSYYSYQYIHSTYGLLFIITGARIYDNDIYIKISTPYIGVKSDNTFVHGRSFNGGLVPDGGTTGQVLAKSSNNNYEVTWVNQTGGSGGGGSSDSNIVIVLCQKDSSGTVSLSMTYDEILSAISANKVVIIKDTAATTYYCSVFIYQYTSSSYGLFFEGTADPRNTYINTPFIGLKSDGTLTLGRVYRNGSVPAGGNAGQFLRKKSSSDYQTEWVDAGAVSGSLPSGGYPGYILQKKSTSDFDAEWVNPGGNFISNVWKNTNFLDTFVGNNSIDIGAGLYVSGKRTVITSNYTLCYADAKDISSDRNMYTIIVPCTSGDGIPGYKFKMQTARGYRYVEIDTDVSFGLLFSDGFNMQGTKDNSIAIPYRIFARYERYNS
nr:MAG TPA: hypothetical protein [Caudoviricetes sp.]